MAAKPAPPATGPRFNFPIFLLALFGMLVVTHLWIQVGRGFTHGCLGFSAPTGEIAGCAEVVGSAFGSFLGVSNVLWGMLFYVAVAALRFGVAVTRPPLSRTLQRASFAAVGVGMIYVGWLLYVQTVALEQYCVLCLISAGITTTLFGLHLLEWRAERGAVRPEPAVVRAVGLRPYALGLAALVVLAAADFALFSDRVEATPATAAFESEDGSPFRPTADQLASACAYDPEIPTLRVFDLLTSGRTAYEGGGEDAPRVLKIFDPNCPACKALHDVLDETIPAYRDRARFYYQPIALWDFSVPQLQALYIAREQSHEAFVQLMDLQFTAQRRGGLSVDTLVAQANRVGLDGEAVRQDIQRGRFADLIRQEYAMVTGAGVRGVPRMVVDGRMIANTGATWTPECIGYFIEQAQARRDA